MRKKLAFSTVLIFLISLPSVLAASHSVTGDLAAFFDAFRCLTRLNTGCMASNIVDAAPLIGLIAVVFGLTYFMAVTTIFKEKEHHKYAKMIAIGIAILGLAQQSVYNTILNWSSILLTASFVIAVIFMFIIFLNHNKKSHHDVAKDMREAKAADLTAKKDLMKIEHDVRLDKKYYKKVDKDLAKLNDDLDEVGRLVGSEKHQVDEIARLLQQLASAAQHGDSGLTHQYAQALGNHVGALISSMKHEDTLDNNVNGLVEKINAILSHWAHDEIKDEVLEKQLEHIVKRAAAHLGHSYDKKKYEQLLVDNRILSNNFHQMHRIIRELSTMRDKLDELTNEFDGLGYKKKHLEASELRTAVFDGDYKKAHHHLDVLRALIEQEPNAVQKLKSASSQAKSLISQLEQHELSVNKIANTELKTITDKMKSDADLKKKVEKIHVKYATNLNSRLSNMYNSLASVYNLLKSAPTKIGVVLEHIHKDLSSEQTMYGINKKDIDKLSHELVHLEQSLSTSLASYSETILGPIQNALVALKELIVKKERDDKVRYQLHHGLKSSTAYSLKLEKILKELESTPIVMLKDTSMSDAFSQYNLVLKQLIGPSLTILNQIVSQLNHEITFIVDEDKHIVKDLKDAGEKDAKEVEFS